VRHPGERAIVRSRTLLAFLATMVAAVGCGGGADVRTVEGTSTTSTTVALTTTSSTPTTSSTVAGVFNLHVRELGRTPGQTTWSHSSNGITITLRIDKASPRVGEAVLFDIEASTASGPCCGVMFRPGELHASVEPGSCFAGEPTGPGSVGSRRTHAYSSPGQFSFIVTAITGLYGGASGATAAFAGTIEVS
jgi:hypothetical protein